MPNYESWTKRTAQAGLVSKGGVYILFGVLILMATYSPRDEPVGLFEILQYIMTKGWFGVLVTALLAIGLLCYSAWKFFQMVLNVEGYEKDIHGYFTRFTWLGPLVFYLVLAVHAIVQLYNWFFGHFLYYQGQESQFQQILDTEWGKYAIGLVSLSLFVNAFTLFYLVFTGKYTIMLTGRDFHHSSPRLARIAGMAGYFTYGVAMFITAALLGYSIYYSDNTYLTGEQSMFTYLIIQPLGQILLGLISTGTILYGVYFLMAAFYRWRDRSSSESSTKTGK